MEEYIQHIQSLLPSLGETEITEEGILAQMKKNQGTYPGDPPDLGDKLDSAARMIARLVSQALKKRDPYNPFTDKRRGDAFDISLLFYIPLPSVICTADEKFVNRLRDTGAFHACQVVTINELNELVRLNGVGALVSDFQTPAEQHRSGAWRLTSIGLTGTDHSTTISRTGSRLSLSPNRGLEIY